MRCHRTHEFQSQIGGQCPLFTPSSKGYCEAKTHPLLCDLQ